MPSRVVVVLLLFKGQVLLGRKLILTYPKGVSILVVRLYHSVITHGKHEADRVRE